MDIIPGIITGTPPDFVSIYTTSPTIIIDIGLIFPTCILGGVALMQNKPTGYILPPIMLTFLAVIAVTVVGQTAAQMAYGVNVPIHQMVGYVGSFVIFGIIAAVVNTRFMRKCWPKPTGDDKERLGHDRNNADRLLPSRPITRKR